MKQFKIILGLILLASVSTFAQSPRIKLNQITKDTVKGSVLISSPTDSGMVYSRDFYIAYGADTVLILYGDTLAATSGIISSVLSDGVTITGDGTTGNELKVDTATVISTIQGLVDSLTNYVTIAGTQTISGAKTFTAALTQSGGDANFDSGTLFVDESANKVGIKTTIPSQPLDIVTAANEGIVFGGTSNSTSKEGGLLMRHYNTAEQDVLGFYAATTNVANNILFGGGASALNAATGLYFYTASNNTTLQGSLRMTIKSDGEVWINNATDRGSYYLQVAGSGVWGQGAYVNGSDFNLKENITPLNSSLQKVLNLNPIKYNYKQEYSIDQSPQLGFIAQEVSSVLGEYSDAVVKDNGNFLSMAYQNLTPLLTKAIQEQQAIIETQQSEIDQLKTLITDLTNRLTILENK